MKNQGRISVNDCNDTSLKRTISNFLCESFNNLA